MSKIPQCPCELSTVCKHPKLTYRGPDNPIILVVGLQPSLVDDATGILFSGEEGEYLRKVFKQLKVNEDAIGYTNLVSCTHTEKLTKVHLSCCRRVLQDTIKQHNKKLSLVLLLGSQVTKTFITKGSFASIVGKIHRLGGVLHLPLREATQLKGKAQEHNFQESIQKAMNLLSLDLDKVFSYDIVDAAGLKQRLPEILSTKKLTFDLETSGLEAWDATQFVIGVGLHYKEGYGVFVPLEHPEVKISAQEYRQRVSLLQQIFRSEVPKEAFNGGFDLMWVEKYLDVPIHEILNYVSDPMHENHFIDEKMKGGTLSNLTLRHLPEMAGYDAEIEILKSQYGEQFANFPLEKIAPYCVGDCVATAKLGKIFVAPLKEERSWNLYRNILIPVIPIYASMTLAGVKIDEPLAKTTEKVYAAKIDEITKDISNLPLLQGRSLKITSTEELGTFLYETCKVPVQQTKRKKGDGSVHFTPSVDKDALENILTLPQVSDDVKVLCQHLLDYSKVKKIHSTYAGGWKSWIGWDGLVHTNYYPSGTVTGRLSSSNPNLQNLPKKDMNGNLGEFLGQWPIRRLFISKFPNGKLVECDFSQLELRLMAALSGDNIMVGTYQDGLNEGDIHKAMAKSLNPNFDTATPDEQEHMRYLAKTENFKGAYSLSAVFLKAYPGFSAYVDRITHKATTKGWVATKFGRRRRLPNLLLEVPSIPVHRMDSVGKDKFFRRLGAIRQAVNLTIQEPGHTLLEMAAKRIYDKLHEGNYRAHLVLEVHDSLVVDAPEEEALEVGLMMKAEMEAVQNELEWLNGVPLVAELKIGSNWEDKQHV